MWNLLKGRRRYSRVTFVMTCVAKPTWENWDVSATISASRMGTAATRKEPNLQRVAVALPAQIASLQHPAVRQVPGVVKTPVRPVFAPLSLLVVQGYGMRVVLLWRTNHAALNAAANKEMRRLVELPLT